MEKGDLIVGRVKMNPVDNEHTPCIKIDLCEGLSDGELVLLEVKNCRWIRELEPIRKIKRKGNGK